MSDHKNKYGFCLQSGYSDLGRGVWVSSSPMNTLEPQIMAISAGRLSLSSLHSAVVFLTVGGVTVVGTPLIAYSSDKNLTWLSSEPFTSLYMEIWILFLINDAQTFFLLNVFVQESKTNQQNSVHWRQSCWFIFYIKLSCLCGGEGRVTRLFIMFLLTIILSCPDSRRHQKTRWWWHQCREQHWKLLN